MSQEQVDRLIEEAYREGFADGIDAEGGQLFPGVVDLAWVISDARERIRNR